MEKLFVYGTLQPGKPNEHVLAPLNGDWQPATLRGYLREVGWGAAMGYPAITLDPDGPEVPGFVFSSAELGAKWPELDAFEGEEYERVQAPVTLADGSGVQAYVYVLRA